MAALVCLFATASAAITSGTATMNNFTAPSFLSPDLLGPWAIYLEQIARVRPYPGELAGLAETLVRPKRILIVDVPIRMDSGEATQYCARLVALRDPGLRQCRF